MVEVIKTYLIYMDRIGKSLIMKTHIFEILSKVNKMPSDRFQK
jgi:hypothetical protein